MLDAVRCEGCILDTGQEAAAADLVDCWFLRREFTALVSAEGIHSAGFCGGNSQLSQSNSWPAAVVWSLCQISLLALLLWM